MLDILFDFARSTGFSILTYKEIIMIMISCLFLYLAIKRGYEPYLLIPIATGMLLVNLPGAGLWTKEDFYTIYIKEHNTEFILH